MFLLFGLGKQTVKRLGKTQEQVCERCQKPSQRILVKVVNWFTLFFIPIFPYLTRYALICPLCDDAREVSRDEVGELLPILKPLDPEERMGSSKYEDQGDTPGDWLFGGSGDGRNPADKSRSGRYQGKNATQIAYLAKLEARDRELAVQREKEETDTGKRRKQGSVLDPEGETEETGEIEAEEAAQRIHAARKSIAEQDAVMDTEEQEAKQEDHRADGRERTRARERALAAREIALEAREKALTAREMTLEARESALDAREKAAEVRERAVEAREEARGADAGE
ncbi:MAG: zinc ribbon domain-containing protein [Clostridiales bacterium]|nr:zinc ribbon domain-containing protein [Clostridiales bacterium]